jgi:Uri superfamily endonuclease
MKGSYILLLELKEDKIITVGKLGDIFFKKGFYVYVGSALNGLEQRIQRHLRYNKMLYWHIDYLLQHAIIKDIFYKVSDMKEECSIAKLLVTQLFYIPSFGSSDCKCKSHLFFESQIKIPCFLNKMGFGKYSF